MTHDELELKSPGPKKRIPMTCFSKEALEKHDAAEREATIEEVCKYLAEDIVLDDYVLNKDNGEHYYVVAHAFDVLKAKLEGDVNGSKN